MQLQSTINEKYCPPNGVILGSSMSGLLALIMTLDIIYVTHHQEHKSNSEYEQCSQDPNGGVYIDTYVDDVYAIIHGEDHKLVDKIKLYQSNIQNYFDSNSLKINMGK